MSRWTWVALGVIFAAGAVTAWHSYRLDAYNLSGLPPRDVDPQLLGLSALPTAVFAAAGVLRRRSARMQLVVAAAAVAVGVLRVLTIRWELAQDWNRGTGAVSALAWAVGLGVALAVLAAAAVATGLANARRARQADPGD